MSHKKSQTMLAVFAFCSFSAFAQTNPTIHPDLIPSRVIDLEKVEQQVNQEISRLNEEDIVPQDVGIPDYKIINYHLQGRISRSLTNFFNRLDSLNMKLKADLSRIKSLDEARLKYNSPEWQEAYDVEVMATYPRISAYFESEYHNAIKGLYSLDGYLDLTVEYTRKGRIDLYGTKYKARGPGRFETGCVTKMCLSRINADVNDWLKLVYSIDTGIQLGKGYVELNLPEMEAKTNRFSMAIANFMEKSIKVKLQDNKVYTNGTAVVDYVEAIGKSSVGAAAGVLYLPVLVFDKVSNFAKKLSPSRVFMFTNISAKKVETYPIEDAINDRNILVEVTRYNLRNVAVGEQEIEEVILRALHNSSEEFDFVVKAIKEDQELLDKVNQAIKGDITKELGYYNCTLKGRRYDSDRDVKQLSALSKHFAEKQCKELENGAYEFYSVKKI